MITKIFTVYDSKSETYLSPFFMRNNGEALRAWEEVVNDNQSSMSKYPQDFTLFEIGTFDDQTASIDLLNAKISLGLGIEYKKATHIKPSHIHANEVLQFDQSQNA